MNPDEPRRPSTYLLTDAEFRTHANALVEEGWTPAEVEQRLSIHRRGMAA